MPILTNKSPFARIALAAACAIALQACCGDIVVKNDTSGEIHNVTILVTGNSARIEKIAKGESGRATVPPKGESVITVQYDSGSVRKSVKVDWYLDTDDARDVIITLHDSNVTYEVK